MRKNNKLTVDEAHRLLEKLYFNCPGYGRILDVPFNGTSLRWFPNACVTSEMFEFLKTFTPPNLKKGFILGDNVSTVDLQIIAKDFLNIFLGVTPCSQNLLQNFLVTVSINLLPGLKIPINASTDTPSIYALLIKYQLWGMQTSDERIQWAKGYELFWDALLEWIRSTINLNQREANEYYKFLSLAESNPEKKPIKPGQNPLLNIYRDHVLMCTICLILQHGYGLIQTNGVYTRKAIDSACKIVSKATEDLGEPIGIRAIEEIWDRLKIFKNTINIKVFYIFSALQQNPDLTSFAVGMMCNNFLPFLTDKNRACLGGLKNIKFAIKTDPQKWRCIVSSVTQ